VQDREISLLRGQSKLKEEIQWSPNQEEDQIIQFKSKDRVKEEIGLRKSPGLRTKSSQSPSRE
jgi:hypothetical protein